MGWYPELDEWLKGLGGGGKAAPQAGPGAAYQAATPAAAPGPSWVRPVVGGMAALASLPGQALSEGLEYLRPGEAAPEGAPAPVPAPVDPYALIPTGGASSSSRTTTVQAGRESMPGYFDMLDKTGQAQAAALQQQAAARAAGAQAQAAAVEASRADQSAAQARAEEDRAAMMARIEEADAEASKIRREVAQAKVDPGRIWSRKGGGDRMALAVAAGLAGMAQGFMGQAGPNWVLQLADRMIDRDIAAQQAAISSKKEALAGQRGVVADLFKQLGSMDAATNQARLMMTEDLKARLAVIGANTDSQTIQANAAQAMGALDERILALKNQAYQQAQAKTATSTSSGGTTQRAMAGTLAEKPKKVKEAPDALINTSVQGVQLMRLADVAKAEIQRGGYGPVGKLIPGSDQKRIRETIIKPMLTRLGRLNAGGVLSDDEYNRSKDALDEMLSTPQAMFESIGTIQKNVAADVAMGIQAFGAAGRDVEGLAGWFVKYTEGKPIPGLK